jgi:hypothetical protein
MIFSFRDFSQITNMKEIFRPDGQDEDDPDKNFRNFDADVSKWDISRVVTIRGLCEESSFNADISEWDTSNIKNMYATFKHARGFNSDISKWAVAKVVTMLEMFKDTTGFEQGIWCDVEWIESPVSGALLGVQGIEGNYPYSPTSKGTHGNAAFCCAAGSYLGGSGKTSFSVTALASKDDCTECSAGSYTNKLNIDRACTLCPKGWHIDVEGRSFCLPCERKC